VWITGNSIYNSNSITSIHNNTKLTYNSEIKFSLTAWNYTDVTYVLVLRCHFNFLLFKPTYSSNTLGCTGDFLSKLVGNKPIKSKEKLFQNKETALLLSKNISQAHNQPYKILMSWNLNLSEWKLARGLCHATRTLQI